MARIFERGDILFNEGDVSASVFLIQQGAVSIQKAKDQGDVEIAIIHANEVIGELSFFDRKPRSATALAKNHVEALELRFEDLDKIYAKVPDYFKTIIASLAERLRKADDTIRNATQLP